MIPGNMISRTNATKTIHTFTFNRISHSTHTTILTIHYTIHRTMILIALNIVSTKYAIKKLEWGGATLLSLYIHFISLSHRTSGT